LEIVPFRFGWPNGSLLWYRLDDVKTRAVVPMVPVPGDRENGVPTLSIEVYGSLLGQTVWFA